MPLVLNSLLLQFKPGNHVFRLLGVSTPLNPCHTAVQIKHALKVHYSKCQNCQDTGVCTEDCDDGHAKFLMVGFIQKRPILISSLRLIIF